MNLVTATVCVTAETARMRIYCIVCCFGCNRTVVYTVDELNADILARPVSSVSIEICCDTCCISCGLTLCVNLTVVYAVFKYGVNSVSLVTRGTATCDNRCYTACSCCLSCRYVCCYVTVVYAVEVMCTVCLTYETAYS